MEVEPALSGKVSRPSRPKPMALKLHAQHHGGDGAQDRRGQGGRHPGDVGYDIEHLKHGVAPQTTRQSGSRWLARKPIICVVQPMVATPAESE